VFGSDTSLIHPENFASKPLREIMNTKQVIFNKLPSAFTPVEIELMPGESIKIYSVIGYAPSMHVLEEYIAKFASEEYLEEKRRENNAIIEEIVGDVYTKTSSQLFDEYVKQCYLDNVLRGGYPIILDKERPLVYYLYMRKHGDQERDYNYFVLTPEYYSTGNANYRDVNQNRREYVFLHPEIRDYDIKFFVNLIQVDGYNPLVINGVKYHCRNIGLETLRELVDRPGELLEYLKQPVTPGRLLMYLEEKGIKTQSIRGSIPRGNH